MRLSGFEYLLGKLCLCHCGCIVAFFTIYIGSFLINHFCFLFEKYFLLTRSMSIYVLGDWMSVVNKIIFSLKFILKYDVPSSQNSGI